MLVLYVIISIVAQGLVSTLMATLGLQFGMVSQVLPFCKAVSNFDLV